jgi:hypothetical protein
MQSGMLSVTDTRGASVKQPASILGNILRNTSSMIGASESALRASQITMTSLLWAVAVVADPSSHLPEYFTTATSAQVLSAVSPATLPCTLVVVHNGSVNLYVSPVSPILRNLLCSTPQYGRPQPTMCHSSRGQSSVLRLWHMHCLSHAYSRSMCQCITVHTPA